MDVSSALKSALIDFVSLKMKSVPLWIAMIFGFAVINMKVVSYLFLITIVSLVFMNEEKGVHAIYFIPTNKSSCVLGRYIFSLMLFLICSCVNILVDFTVPFLYDSYISSGFIFYILMLSVFIVLIAFEFPLLYWMGYAKVRLVQYVLLMLFLLLFLKRIDETALYRMSTELVLSGSLIAGAMLGSAVLLVLSIFLSCKLYSTREI